MWELDLYARLDLADAWAIIGPINWYAPSSNLKLMFDRLVCMNGGNPREDLIEHKNPELAMELEQSPEWKSYNLNHLEGRTAAFFLYGDQVPAAGQEARRREAEMARSAPAVRTPAERIVTRLAARAGPEPRATLHPKRSKVERRP
ncbi:MAG TPA: hypothetical protein VFT98_06920 [Myxococcota bacterium]|nr:hypothetical protein [Myxococcota bacterium]